MNLFESIPAAIGLGALPSLEPGHGCPRSLDSLD